MQMQYKLQPWWLIYFILLPSTIIIEHKSTLQRLLDLAGLRYTTSEKSGPSWQSMLHNFLSRPLSFLGWTTAMLFWLDFHQTQSNLYKWFRMQRHDWSSMSPKEPMLLLSSSHCTGCLHTERPQAQHPPTSTHYYESTSPPEVWDLLVSDALWYHHREAQNHSPEHSRSPFLAGGIIFPPLSGMLDPCQSSSNNWKLISFGTTWLHPKLVLKKNKKLSLYLSLLPLLACTYLNNDWDLVLRALPLSCKQKSRRVWVSHCGDCRPPQTLKHFLLSMTHISFLKPDYKEVHLLRIFSCRQDTPEYCWFSRTVEDTLYKNCDYMTE